MIPKTILDALEKEISNLKFGKIMLGVNIRDGRVQYFEFIKNYTIHSDETQKSNLGKNLEGVKNV